MGHPDLDVGHPSTYTYDVVHSDPKSPPSELDSIPRCWAACLGDCKGGMSGERTVSQCLFPSGGVTVKGLHWCRDEAVTIGIGSLTTNILCREHNGRLSDVDDYAKKAFNTLSASMELSHLRTQLRQDYCKRHSPRAFRLFRILWGGLRVVDRLHVSQFEHAVEHGDGHRDRQRAGKPSFHVIVAVAVGIIAGNDQAENPDVDNPVDGSGDDETQCAEASELIEHKRKDCYHREQFGGAERDVNSARRVGVQQRTVG